MLSALLATIVLSPSLVLPAVLLSPSQPITNSLPPGPPPGLQLPGNITQLYTNISSPPSNILRIQCDGVHYGSNLNPNSCRNVFQYLGRSDEQYTYSERHTGRVGDIPLPMRLVSNDGLCFVQPLLLHGAVTGRASGTEIVQAAYALFERCVVEKGIGGIATDIGGDNHLNVVITDYAPRVRCDRSATPGPPFPSCLVIIADMNASKDRKVFGDKSRDPRVEVNMPFTFKANALILGPSLAEIADARCQASIGITGKSTSASWYEIWEAVAALNAMCVRGHSKGGKAFGLGLRKNIFVQISDEHPDLSQPAANTVDIPGSAPLLGLDAFNASFE